MPHAQRPNQHTGSLRKQHSQHGHTQSTLNTIIHLNLMEEKPVQLSNSNTLSARVEEYIFCFNRKFIITFFWDRGWETSY